MISRKRAQMSLVKAYFRATGGRDVEEDFKAAFKRTESEVYPTPLFQKFLKNAPA